MGACRLEVRGGPYRKHINVQNIVAGSLCRNFYDKAIIKYPIRRKIKN